MGVSATIDVCGNVRPGCPINPYLNDFLEATKGSSLVAFMPNAVNGDHFLADSTSTAITTTAFAATTPNTNVAARSSNDNFFKRRRIVGEHDYHNETLKRHKVLLIGNINAAIYPLRTAGRRKIGIFKQD